MTAAPYAKIDTECIEMVGGNLRLNAAYLQNADRQSKYLISMLTTHLPIRPKA